MLNKIKGCLFGLAIGDALGFPIEFFDLEKVKHKFGDKGVTNYVNDGFIYKGMISDDTQMSISTAVGCIQVFKQYKEDIANHITESIYEAYKDWLYSQDEDYRNRRAPGNTCLSALRRTRMGTLENPLNNSKGCGAVMRSAPIGLIFSPEKAFQLGVESGVITHGHPSGYLPAGFLSMLISCLMKGIPLGQAIDMSFNKIGQYMGHEETQAKIREAVRLAVDKNANEKMSELGTSEEDEENITKIGEGWTGEEALAIALYSVLRYPDDFSKAVLLSVNHSGDSDSTGCVTGAIAGTLLGVDAIPNEWRKKNEVKSTLNILSDQLFEINKA